MAVSPTSPRPEFHLELVAENGTTFGVILCDAQGNRLNTATARTNLQTAPVKISSGESQYGDQELPFVTSPQSDWSGGMGQERFEDNRTKYHTGRRIQTVEGGKVTLGPRDHFSFGTFPQVFSLPPEGSGEGEQEIGRIGRLRWYPADPAIPDRIATRFTNTYGAIVDPTFLWLMVQFRGLPVGDSHLLFWELRANDAGNAPGTLLDAGDWGSSWEFDRLLRWHESGVTDMVNIAVGTSYWLVLYPNPDATVNSHVVLGYWQDPDAATPFVGTSVVSFDNGATWSAYPHTDYQLMFRITQPPGTITGGHPFMYKNQFYVLTRGASDVIAPRLWRNGWRGAADSNAGDLTKLFDATQAWGTSPIGCIVWAYSGPGSQEEIPYRRVTASANGELTVGPSGWFIPHTTDTEYVVLGSNIWNEVVHTIPLPATDAPAIAVGATPPQADQVIAYIPQGHNPVATPIWMYREYNNAGVWTVESKSINDGTGGAGNFQARLMILVEDATLGPMIYKVEDNRGGAGAVAGIAAMSRAPGTWTSQLGWGADEPVGDSQPASLVNAIEWVDPDTDERIPWVFTRDKIYARREGEWRSLKLDELVAFASERTGFVATVHDTKLFLSLAGGLFEQLVNDTLIDVGPGKGVGLSRDHRGEVESATAYPGQRFVVIDIGPGLDGFSAIFRHTGLDSWDPIYESPRGRRIRWVHAQRIPSVRKTPAIENRGLVSRLWFQEGEDFKWLDLAAQGLSPLTDLNYQFAPEGLLGMSRVYANLDDRLKVFSSVKIVSDDLNATIGVGAPDATVWIEPEYQLDVDDEWGTVFLAAIGGIATVSPSQEIFLTNYTAEQIVPIRGRYLKPRLRLNTVLGNQAPVVKAVLLESVLGLPVKFAFATTFVLEDDGLDLNNAPISEPTALERLNRLQGYANTMELFTVRSIAPSWHGKKVLIAAPEIRPVGISDDAANTTEQIAKEKYVASMTIIQVIL